MRSLVQERERAVALRKQGLSYRDILLQVPVAKSSLSLWLKGLPLTPSEKHALKNRKNNNISRGRIKAAGVLSARRLSRESSWLEEARQIYQRSVSDPFFHAGIILYWAEGAKRANQWSFINSDEEMNETMVRWLERYCGLDRNSFRYRLYSHKLYAHEGCEEWWQKKLGVDPSRFSRTVYKPSGCGVKKRPEYKGCLRIEVPKSKGLLLKMKFWKAMLVDSYRKE